MICTFRRPGVGIVALSVAMLAFSGGAALAKSGPTYSDKFIAAAQPAEATLKGLKAKAGDAAALTAAKKQVDAEVALAASPDEKLLAGQDTYQFGQIAQDQAVQRQGAQLMLDSGKAPADLTPRLQLVVGELAYVAKDYPAAIPQLKAAIAAGVGGPNDYAMLAQSLVTTNQIADGVAAWSQAITKGAAAGPVDEAWYGEALQLAYNNQMKPQTLEFGRMMVTAYPTRKNWTAVVQTTLGLSEARTPGEELDLLRLMATAGEIRQKPYLQDYIRVADPRALPFEVKSVIDQAVAAGVTTPSDPTVSSGYSIASQRVAAERAALPGYHRDLAAGGAAALAGDADSYLAFQQYPDAVTFYQAALAKGGDADTLNTRLGIAQIGAGDYAGAQATLAKVGGNRAPIAQLWTTYAKQKAAGK